MKKKVLIIDDETDILDLARIAIEGGGYEVFIATSAEEAQPIITEKNPSLILLDVVLPGTSGLELCRQLKRNPVTKGVKVILFTALGTEVDMMLEKKDKADAYMAKPFSPSLLLSLVKLQLGDK